MGERKVLNKYYPPDFDTKYLKQFGQRNSGYDPFKQIEVRMMLPFSVQCTKCGEFSYRGKKFNSKKENVHGEDYKGIKKVRFYMKCGVCSNIFSIKTDPEHGDYEVEFGVTRNFESWKKAREEDEREAAEKEAEEMGDSMKALENRTLAQKMEADQIDALDGILALNKRNEKLNVDAVLADREQQRQQKQAAAAAAAQATLAAADKEAEEIFKKRRNKIKRISDTTAAAEPGEGGASAGGKWAAMFSASLPAPAAAGVPEGGASAGVALGTKRKATDAIASSSSSSSAPPSAAAGAGVLAPPPGGLVVVRAKKAKGDKKEKKKKKKDKKDKKKAAAAAAPAAAAPAAAAPAAAAPAAAATGALGLGLGDYASSSSD